MSTPTRTVFGPAPRTKLDLMGIRFGDAGGDGGGAGGDGGDGGAGDGGTGSTYTPPASQDDLNRIIEGRLAQERKKYSDYDDLKAAKSDYDQLLEAQKTDAQKAIDAAKGEVTTEVTQRFLSRIVSAEVKAVAGALGFNDPADALQVIDPQKLPVKDDEADSDAIKAAVEELAKNKPYLVGAKRTTAPVTKPKPAAGEKQDDKHEGKGRAAAALRQLGASRRSGAAET